MCRSCCSRGRRSHPLQALGLRGSRGDGKQDGRLLRPWPYCQLHLQAGYRSAGMRDCKLRERGGSIFCQIRHQYVYASGIRSHCPFTGKIPRYDQPGCKTPPQRTGHRSGSSQKSAGMGGVGCAEAAAVGAAEAIPSRRWGYGASPV